MEMEAADNGHLVDGKYGIGDIVDLKQLQLIFEHFTAATGFTIGFLDHPALNILIATGWRDICTKFHRSCPEAEAVCLKSNRCLLDRLDEPGRIVAEQCGHGLVDCAIPIIVNGKHIASLATGQLFMQEPDLEDYRQRARQYGFDEEAYLEAVKEIPVIETKKLEAVTALLGEIAVVVSQLGYANLAAKAEAGRLANEIAERRRAEEELHLSERRKMILNRIDHVFLTVPDEEMYGEVLDVVLSTMQSPFGIFGYIDEKGDLVIPSLTRDVWDRCRVPGKAVSFPAGGWGESIWGAAIRKRRSFLSEGPFNTPEGHIRIENFLTVPIVSRDATIGLLSVANKEGGYTERDRNLLSGIAGHISPILNARLQRDIQERERKRAEEALRESEAKIRSVFEAAPVGLCIMKGRVFQSASKDWYDRFGYSVSEIIGHTTRMLYESEEEYRRVGRDLYRSLAEQDVAYVETRLRSKKSGVRDVILRAAPLQPNDAALGTVVSIEDITDYRRAIRESEESRRQLADIIEFLPDATLVVDREGRVIAWNRAMEVMTGVKKEDMLGRGNYEYALPFYGERRPILIDLALHPDPEMEKRYTAVQRIGDSLLGESFTPNLPPGDIHLSATASVLRDSRGEIVAAIECIRDNTERRRLEERLSRAEKMEGLGRLAGGVAHDLNNVLGVMVGYSELLAEKLHEGSTLRDYADNIHRSSVKGAAIIQDLLTLARRGVNTAAVVDLNRVVVEYLRSPEFQALKSVHPDMALRKELAVGLLPVKGSSVHLGKALMNLVTNAAEAASEGADVTITVRTENRYLDRTLRGYDDMQEGDYAVLTVADTGGGIPARDLGKIFEPFYTKKFMGRSGTGLGLAIVWGVVKDHGGYIDVQSREGQGSTFTLYFPVTREAFASEEKAASREAYMGRGESILVVDDVQAQRNLASSMLERLGYRVKAVESGEAAVEYLRGNRADLVVLDMIMDPGIDGLETYARILAIHPHQKAIILSGYAETDRVREAQALGAGEFVRKPYVLEKIGLAVRRELDRE